MNQNMIILPVFVQVLLTIGVLFVMGTRRRTALVSKTTRLKDIALGQNAWPADATKASNNYKNQFEIPVLFFAACAFALITKTVDFWMMFWAIVFVVSRIVHAGIHLGANPVMPRAYVFFIGPIAVLVMWITIVVRAVLPVL
jgi:hypothetical protein